MSEIQFTWKGKQYIVKSAAYNKDYIVLPNRKVLGQLKWVEVSPPQLELAEEVAHNLEHASVGEIADHMGNAILAHEAE